MEFHSRKLRFVTSKIGGHLVMNSYYEFLFSSRALIKCEALSSLSIWVRSNKEEQVKNKHFYVKFWKKLKMRSI